MSGGEDGGGPDGGPDGGADRGDGRALHPGATQIPPFARLIGLRIVSATAEEVVGEMLVSPDHLNRNGTLHGGAMMAMADHMGGTGAFMNIDPDHGAATVESKTNFIRAVKAGEVVRAVCTPLHLGRSTMIFQTAVTREDGKLAAMVTQTQMVLQKPKFS